MLNKCTKDVFFEKVSLSNLDKVIDIQCKIFPEEDGSLNLKASVDKDVFRKIYKNRPRKDLIFWLVKVNDFIVGITGIYSYTKYPDDAWLGWFGVIEEERRKGYASYILDWTMQQAQERGYKNLRLYTSIITDIEAVEFYKSKNMIMEEYTSEPQISDEIVIFSSSLTQNKVELWDNKHLELYEQYSLQENRN